MINTAATVSHFVGDAATLALNVGNVALPIIQFVAPWIPVVGPILTDIEVALPIIQKIAQYAPAVQQGLQNNKPMIEAMAGVGAALFAPLSELSVKFPGALIAGVAVEAFLKANEFTPQDPRFYRDDVTATT
ncbi:MAG: hypothetical protein KGL39_06330 [Patescibacteria group bacterium]|nr:hypothetical protein [Patescibacteria group bacterium]